MGNNEGGTPLKSEKASSPVQEQSSIPSYPDWSAFQAYYGPGVAIPPPYFGSAVASGHTPPPYMWPPQPLIPPYGAPYAAIYPHGGIYGHPSVSLTPLSIDTPAKSSGSNDQGLVKKLKGFDGLAVSIGNGNVENTQADAGHSNSEENGTEGSSDGSDGNTSQEGYNMQRKRTSEDLTATSTDGKIDSESPTLHVGEDTSIRPPVATIAFPTAGKPAGNVPSSSMTIAKEFKGPATTKPLATAAAIVAATPVAASGRNCFSSGLWIQNERELKRERRKLSNRESARRSRLRKQAESEELAMKVESLNAENMALRAEIGRLSESSKKLRLDNSNLMEKLRNAQLEKAEGKVPDKDES